MKKLLLLFCLTIFILSVKISFADTTQINAGVLPSVWYSSININDQDLIKIFGAIQNHSDINFSGVVSIFVDGEITSKVNFTALQNSLTEISGPWKTLAGSHSVQLIITDISVNSGTTSDSFGTSTLLSFESDKTTLSIVKPVTLQDVEQKTQELAQNTVDTISTIANNLADKIETLKQPVISDTNTLSNGPVSVNKNSSVNQSNTAKTATNSAGQVLGAETKYQATSTSGIFKYPIVTTIYNKTIDFISLMVRNWQITIFVFVILFIIFRYFIF
jgi:hypothetical protein